MKIPTPTPEQADTFWALIGLIAVVKFMALLALMRG